MKGELSLANKKIFMSVTATAVIASAFIAAENAEAASHKVKSGDSLWAIAQKYNTTVSQLKSINKLSGDLIHPNQIIETEKKSSSGTKTESGSSAKPSQPAKKSNTYTVKRGDTLSEIAAKHKISLKDLMKWNNLDTTLIFPGNVFVVSKNGATTESGSSSPSNSGSAGNGNSNSGSSSSSGGNSSGSSSSVYTVKSGDTLSHIASRNGVTVANLKKWNNLSSDLILIGQKLSIGEAAKNNGSSANKGNSGSSSNSGSNASSASEKAPEDVSYNVDKLVKAANAMLGVKYVWGGQTASGFDCSGFIHYAYNEAGRTGARLSTDGYYDRSYEVDKPQIGDLVFFSGTYRSGISHMGIYVGNNEFIHAGTSTGVTITNLDNSYWSKHFDSFKRFY